MRLGRRDLPGRESARVRRCRGSSMTAVLLLLSFSLACCLIRLAMTEYEKGELKKRLERTERRYDLMQSAWFRATNEIKSLKVEVGLLEAGHVQGPKIPTDADLQRGTW